MLAKLAFRNVKRQIGNYLIYFITVALTVALMFAINNAIYSQQLQEYAQNIREMRTALLTITIFVSLIVAFVLGYATSFLLKLRKREFGTYLTLGDKGQYPDDICAGNPHYEHCGADCGNCNRLVFVSGTDAVADETTGNGVYHCFLFCKRACIYHCACGCNVFAVVLYLCHVFEKGRISKLLHGTKVVEKKVKHPVFWLIVTLISLGLIIWSCIAFYHSIHDTMIGASSAAEATFFSSMVVLAVALFSSTLALPAVW